jgi:hypothetical protein
MAYITTDLDGRGYVCFDSTKCPSVLQLRPPPVKYPCLEGCTRLASDCPLWAPYVDGSRSPWGTGHSTVNLEYVLARCTEFDSY